MKRYVCTVAAGFLLALASTGTATASGLPVLGQSGTQATSFGDQTIGEQSNAADVTQKQGNGNVNVSPAIAVFGDAETTNSQGNENVATADVDQSNTADQSQSSTQYQSLDRSDADCCGGPSQTAEQTVYGGDQTVGEQYNGADVSQYQGNGNVNVSPAIAVFGDATTSNAQGNANSASADVEQSNEATQSQSSTQKQYVGRDGGRCCDGRSQTAEQTTSFGDQSVGEQSNDATVTQKQGNGNVNVSPAIAVFGDAETTNSQGNGNRADASVTQSNEATQSQSSSQSQWLEQSGGSCCRDQSQIAKQILDGGDQTVGKQSNVASVEQWQGNGNVNVSPAIAVFGDAETTNSQGNGNRADASVTQSNDAKQSQSSRQTQNARQGGWCCKPTHAHCDHHERCESRTWSWKGNRCCAPVQSQAAEQRAAFGDQTVREQRNDASVTQKQGNGNVNFSPAIGLAGGKGYSCRSECSKSWKPSNGDASTTNDQGNGNRATATVDQSNSAEQSQVSDQRQWVVDMCKGLIYR